MTTHRKSWTSQEKLEIINYYKHHGIAKTKREYDVSSTSVYKWESQYETDGMAGLEGRAGKEKSAQGKELKRLRRENDQLKRLLADKELALRIKEELLKKSR